MGGWAKIRLTKDLPGGYQAGQIVDCDASSAKALIDRGGAEAVEEDQGADAPAADEAVVLQPPVTRHSAKPELVEFAVASGWTQGQAESSTRAQIADAFGLE